MGRPRILDKRFCYSCGSDKTYHRKDGRKQWLCNPPTGLLICRKCQRHLWADREVSKRYNRIANERRRNRNQEFKGKHLVYLYDIRCGVCNWCRAVMDIDTKATQLHHDENKYDDNDPLKYTIELCLRCHGKVGANQMGYKLNPARLLSWDKYTTW